MRYWFRALLGIALAAAAVTVVTWCTWALTRTSTCVASDTQLACEIEPDGLAVILAVALFLAIPIASGIFAGRTKPRSSHLGLLAIGLAITCAGGAALWSALGSASGDTTAEIISYCVAGVCLSIGPFFLLGGIATTGRRGPGRASAAREQSEKVLAANGGDLARSLAAVRTAQQSGAIRRDAPRSEQQIKLGTLATQLSQIANARERTGGDAIAVRLRQLDDLRASGLLSPEEHERKRREVLDQI